MSDEERSLKVALDNIVKKKKKSDNLFAVRRKIVWLSLNITVQCINLVIPFKSKRGTKR